MSGLFFLAVVFIWIVAAIMLTRWLMRRIPIKSELARMLLALALFALIFVLPVTDEIIGGYQFRKLCENSALKIDAEKAKGKTVKLVIDPSNEILRGTAITIYHSHMSYRDINTNEEIASNNKYVAKGGWFIKMLGVFEGDGPLTLSPTYCSPSLGGLAIARNYGFFIQQ